MAYIGRSPDYGIFERQSLTIDGVNDTYSLGWPVASENQLLVVLGGVVQQPGSAYTAVNSGNSIKFTEVPTAGLDCYIIFLGQTVAAATMSTGSITTAMLADGAITSAKIADGTVIATDVLDNTITSAKLTTTGVTAATYGGTTQHTVVTIDSSGRITSAANATPSIANTQITGLITSGQIATVANTQVTGLITSGQIVSVANTQITGNILSSQISGLGTMSSQNASSVTITGGSATLTALKETKVAMAASDIDLSLGNFFNKTITTTTTLTVSNVPAANTAVSFVLELTNGGASTVNWFGNVKWAGGTAPSLTSSGKDSIGFYTFDGGSNWNGFKLGLDIK